MSVDPHSISLSDSQRQQLADLANQSGRPWPELLAEAIASYRPRVEANGNSAESFSAAAARLGLLGCVEGPADLSTNPIHMEGFGQRAN
jgi:predicted transcriptional regulator